MHAEEEQAPSPDPLPRGPIGFCDQGLRDRKLGVKIRIQ